MTEIVTLRDVMQKTPLGKATVLAGEAGLDKEVRETNIIEVPDTFRWMRGGEILFSAGYAFGGNGEQGAALIQELAARGITALVLKPGKYMSEVPKAMIEQAEALGFPLLKMPEDMPYSVCMEAAYDLLKDSRLYELRMVTHLHNELLQAGIHGGIDGICRTLEMRLGRGIALWDKDWRMCFGSERFPLLGEQLKEGVQSEEVQKAISSFYILPTEIGAADAKLFLGVQCAEGNPQESEMVVLRYATSLLSLEALREDELEQQYMRLNGALLDNLLLGRRTDPAILRRQLAEYHIDWYNNWVIFAFRGVGEELPERRLWHILRQRARENELSFLITRKNNCIVGALFFDRKSHTDIQRLLSGLPIEGKFGLSRRGNDLADFADYAKEAETALEVLCRIETDTRAAALEELGIYYPLSEMQNLEPMQRLFTQTMGAVIQYDAENEGALLETLEQYFHCGCNLRMTAEKMFLHKNSVSYRLHKVEELTGRSMDDMQFRLELQLCLLYRHLL